MTQFVNWLNETWVILAAVVGGITVMWNFLHKTVKEIKEELNKPFKEIEAKFDAVNKRLDGFKEIMQKEEDNQKLVTNALQTMQRQSILRACEDCLRRGYADMHMRETISKQVDSYVALGGNSFILDSFKQVEALPFEDKTK